MSTRQPEFDLIFSAELFGHLQDLHSVTNTCPLVRDKWILQQYRTWEILENINIYVQKQVDFHLGKLNLMLLTRMDKFA